MACYVSVVSKVSVRQPLALEERLIIIDSGKTTVLATVVEKLDVESSGKTALFYLNCGLSRGGATAKKFSVEAVCNTLLYLLYERARYDENNVKLLEECNKVFAIPKKEKDRSSALTKSSKTESLPDFVDAFLAIASRLEVNIIVALDETDGLDADDQQELAIRVEGVLTSPKVTTDETRFVKFLVGCRSISKFYNRVRDMKRLLRSIDVGECNDPDMEKQLADALKDIPGLTQAEQKEATDAILKKAGPRFAYITTIAVPFMREPFQRPLSRRLQGLPDGMESVYTDALRKMGPNYVELLRTTLLWSLLALVPLQDYEIMDAYHGTYSQRGPDVEKEASALVDGQFPKCSKLEIEQLQDARGPFLRLELEPRTERYLVNLEDPPQIRDFCLDTKETHPYDVSNEAHICSRCTASTSVTNTLTISSKKGHLKLALDCLRTMNNAVFQRRATNNDEIPLWSQSATSNEVSKIESPAQKDDSVVSEANRIPETVLVEEGERTLNVQDTAEQPDGEIDVEGKISISENAISDAIPAEDGNIGEGSQDKDPDDSQDDEDRGELDLSKVAETRDSEPDNQFVGVRVDRYEVLYWSYHIQQAEALWDPEERSESSVWSELIVELDYWVTENVDWFGRWQLEEPTLARHEGRLKALHVAAYLGLTSWVSHLLKNGAEIDEAPYGVSETPLQVAADTENSLEMLQLLLENGADPNMAMNGSTPACEHILVYSLSIVLIN